MEILNGIGLDIPPVNTTDLAYPIMHTFSSLLFLGVYALQAVLGHPEGTRARWHGDILKRSVDSFVATEQPIALQKLLCNIGASGCAAAGAASGVVIASPSKTNPDCELTRLCPLPGTLLTLGVLEDFFSWSRDSALVFKTIVDTFIHSYDANLQSEIENYIAAQAKLQGVSNPSGSLSDGSGLGEPKFNVDLTPFTGAWGKKTTQHVRLT